MQGTPVGPCPFHTVIFSSFASGPSEEWPLAARHSVGHLLDCLDTKDQWATHVLASHSSVYFLDMGQVLP